MFSKIAKGVKEGFVFHYPRTRREIAYRRGVETGEIAAWKYGYALFVTLLFFDGAGLINLVAVFRRVIEFDPLVVSGLVLGAGMLGVSAGVACFRNWAANPDLVIETRPRGRPPKTPM
ncbi:MAG: hypothetical protein M0R66_02480 [Candidatus Omnitrophica bacterium]|jgi:hypothetical protein|nr:hypothetical protein [Sphaerochaeta sp.]MCK9603234.1 hypothetical protein [Candidatus Omnitrophota bacterium]